MTEAMQIDGMVPVYLTDYGQMKMQPGLWVLMQRIERMTVTKGGEVSRSRQGKMALEWLGEIERAIMRQSREAWERGEAPEWVGLNQNLDVVMK